MAKKRPPYPTEGRDDDGDDTPMITYETVPASGPVDTGATTSAHEKTDSLLDQMLGNDSHGLGFISIQRDHGNNHVISCGRVPTDKYDYFGLLDYIRDNFGAGDYRLMLFINGKRGCQENKLVTIERAQNLLPATQAGGSTADALIADVMRQMMADNRKAQEETMKRIEAMAANNRGDAGVSFLDAMKVMGPMLVPVVLKMLERKPDNSMEQLRTLLAITGDVKEMRADAAPATNADGSTDWAGIIREGLQVLPAVLASRGAPPIAIPNAQNNRAPADGQRSPVLEGGQPGHPFYAQIDGLCQAAAQDADAEEVAGIVWEQMPAPQRSLLIGFLDRKGAIKEMMAIHPGVLDHVEWFAELRQCLIYTADNANNAANADIEGTVADEFVKPETPGQGNA